MQRAMDTAVSGLTSSALKMDVISNNISNASTVGFKSSSVSFTDLYYEKFRNATPSSGMRAGMNPAAVGLGVKVGAVTVNHAQGVLTSTGKDLDIALKGPGFFVVTDGQTDYYTRNGNLSVSPGDNSLCLPDGMKVLGYAADADGKPDIKAGLKPIVVPSNKDTIARATTTVGLSNNLDRKMAVGEQTDVPFSVIDSLGTKYDMKMTLEMTGPGTANWTVSGPAGLTGNSGTITFDATGKVSDFTGGPLEFTPIGASPISVKMDFSGMTYFDKDTDVAVTKQDGMLAGQLQGFSISDGGVVQGNYSNGPPP